MALGTWRNKANIPATSEVAACRKETKGEKCGKEAHNWIEGKVEILGKLVNVKLPVCDEHLEEFRDRDASYSIGEQDD